jgi:DnaK suppressor protein
LLQQIEQALARLDNGTYGYCEDTGEPINLRRLDAQPMAILTTEAQARRERSGT